MSKSVIYLSNTVKNTNAHRLAKDSYYLVYLVDDAGVGFPALFTDTELSRATERAVKNPEDVQDVTYKESWFRKLARVLGICE